MIAVASVIVNRVMGVDRLWLELSSIFAFSAVLFFIGIARSRTHDHASESVPADNLSEVLRDGNFQIEITGAYAGWSHASPDSAFNEIALLLKVRIAPTGDTSAKIKSWEVKTCRYEDRDGWWIAMNLKDIPMGLVCRPLGTNNVIQSPLAGGVSPSIIDITYQRLIPAGDGADGYLLIQSFDDHIESLFSRSFRIQVTDFRGDGSWAIFHPGDWVRLADFSVSPYIVQGDDFRSPRGL